MKFGYSRVSSSHQSESIQKQHEALIAAGCDSNRCYSDIISKTNWQRLGLDTALSLMSTGDTLVVTRLDRLGKNLQEIVTSIADLSIRNINLQVLDPALDTSHPEDKVVLRVMESLALGEKNLFRQQTQKGVERARSEGRVAGPKPKLSPDQINEARKTLASGESVSEVARRLGVARSTLYRALEKIATGKKR